MALDLSKEIGHSFIPRKKVENWKGRVVVRSIRIELAMAEEPENDGGAPDVQCRVAGLVR